MTYARFFASVALILTVISCSPTQHIRGNLLDLDEVKKIEVGKTTKGDLRAFGAALQQRTFVGMLGTTWVTRLKTNPSLIPR